MATLASDSFDRANNTSIGSDWTEVVGTWDITSNLLVLTTHGASDDVATWDTALNASPAADYDVTSTFNITTTGGQHMGGRYTDASNWYRARISTVSQYLRLEKNVAGSKTTLGQYNGGQSITTNYVIKLSMVGSAIKVFQDTVERISVSDSDITATGKPFCGADSSGKTFNDFLVEGTEASVGGISRNIFMTTSKFFGS